jgi:hypothetical protein
MLQRALLTYSAVIALGLGLFGCGGDAKTDGPGMKPAPEEAKAAPEQKAEGADEKEPAAKLEGLEAKVSQFAPAELQADLSKLPDNERKALDELIAAAKLLDPVFDRQAWAGNPQLEAKLKGSDVKEDKTKYRYFQIMRGPWDRQDHHAPFAVDIEHPKGAGFYPEDLTVEEFEKYVADNRKQKKALESLFTVVKRDGDKLVTVPYSKEYAEWLEPAAAHLEAAATLTKNASLSKFLESRAAAFRSDDYYQSDKDWMDLDSPIEITIGPYETYEDQLLGKKAAFEAFVTVSDPDASAALDKYKAMLPEMERNLPILEEAKTQRGAESPIRVVDLVYTSGDARKSVQTIAFNLPNDERVRKEKGAKKVLLRNIITTKFDLIMRPIAEQIIDKEQLQYLSSDAFFNEVLFHELSHSLGPAFTHIGGKKVEVREALGSSYSALEEAKADVMGAWNILLLITKREFPQEYREKLLLSYFAGLFRSVRFGVAEAHGQGAAVQINRFINFGGATWNEDTQRFTVNFDRVEEAIALLVSDICMLQHEGDKAQVESMLAAEGKLTPQIEAALAKLDGIPVDIRPSYPLAEGVGD